MEVELEIVDATTKKTIVTLRNLNGASTIEDVKRSFQNSKLYSVDRQSFKVEIRGRLLANNVILKDVGLENGGILYFKDLGPQIRWTTVFLAEYAGPLVIYLLFYARPCFIYGDSAGITRSFASNIACLCWTLHYTKRLLETLFVHRFSHDTMPLLNLFKNCAYYWIFATFVSYYNNHPRYTQPVFGNIQVLFGLAGFLICEYGNLSIHMALRDLRPAGTTERKMPKPTKNPMTLLFKFVSCPNYTYEFGSWLFFSVLCQSLPALIFAVVGFGQMAMWALAKHESYKREFPNYPSVRKAILPFVL